MLDQRTITKQFDNFIVDVWGILTDGKELYEDGLYFLNDLQTKQKQVVLVSNTPLLSHQLKMKLDHLGIDDSFYNHLVTAGDVCRDYILNNDMIKQVGSHYYLIHDEKHSMLENTPFIETDSIRDAHFVLIIGATEQDYTQVFNHALQRNLPVICANPDLSILTKDGQTKYCAGKIAQLYEKMDGTVIYTGKPYANIYEYVYKKASINSINKTLAIGDTLDTDIKGANQQHLYSVLVARHKNTSISPTSTTQPNIIVTSLMELL